MLKLINSLSILLPKMSGHVKSFGESKDISFLNKRWWIVRKI